MTPADLVRSASALVCPPVPPRARASRRECMRQRTRASHRTTWVIVLSSAALLVAGCGGSNHDAQDRQIPNVQYRFHDKAAFESYVQNAVVQQYADQGMTVLPSRTDCIKTSGTSAHCFVDFTDNYGAKQQMGLTIECQGVDEQGGHGCHVTGETL